MTALALGVQMPPQRTRPRRLTIDVSTDLYQWLGEARLKDRLTTADRIRAVLELCREDEQLAAQVVAKASELAVREASTE